MTQTQRSTYTPTFMEKLLGRNYKWWFLFLFSFKTSTAYRISTLIWSASSALTFFFTLLIWYVNINSGSTIFNFENIFTYYLIGSALLMRNGLNWNIGNSVKDGSINSKLLTPGSTLFRVYVGDAGWWVFPNLVDKLILFVVFLFGHNLIIQTSGMNLVLFLLLAVIGYICTVFIGIIIGSLAFFLTDVQGVIGVQQNLENFLSGRAVPLNVAGFLAIFQTLPFAFIFYHPMQAYLGNYDNVQTGWTLLGGIIWCVVLYFLAKLIFKIGLKRNEAVGL